MDTFISAYSAAVPGTGWWGLATHRVFITFSFRLGATNSVFGNIRGTISRLPPSFLKLFSTRAWFFALGSSRLQRLPRSDGICDSNEMYHLLFSFWLLLVEQAQSHLHPQNHQKPTMFLIESFLDGGFLFTFHGLLNTESFDSACF